MSTQALNPSSRIFATLKPRILNLVLTLSNLSEIEYDLLVFTSRAELTDTELFAGKIKGVSPVTNKEALVRQLIGFHRS